MKYLKNHRSREIGKEPPEEKGWYIPQDHDHKHSCVRGTERHSNILLFSKPPHISISVFKNYLNVALTQWTLGMASEITIVNMFVVQTLHRNCTPLAIIARETTVKTRKIDRCGGVEKSQRYKIQLFSNFKFSIFQFKFPPNFMVV